MHPQGHSCCGMHPMGSLKGHEDMCTGFWKDHDIRHLGPAESPAHGPSENAEPLQGPGCKLHTVSAPWLVTHLADYTPGAHTRAGEIVTHRLRPLVSYKPGVPLPQATQSAIAKGHKV
jgi:hypothetical protein